MITKPLNCSCPRKARKQEKNLAEKDINKFFGIEDENVGKMFIKLMREIAVDMKDIITESNNTNPVDSIHENCNVIADWCRLNALNTLSGETIYFDIYMRHLLTFIYLNFW